MDRRPARIQSLILPIGISFYTFHSMSYMIDIYRRNIVPTTNFADVALYILFFPQLVAGPIVRATDLLPQMREARSFAKVRVRFFLLMFLIGYFKKSVVSDNLAPFIDAFYANVGGYGATDAAIASLFYSVQIYCDFSGYTDMAIASARPPGLPAQAELQLPLLGRQSHRLLAPMAHQPVDWSARLSVHSARRQSRRHAFSGRATS